MRELYDKNKEQFISRLGVKTRVITINKDEENGSSSLDTITDIKK